ncbi:hypothetical protein ACSTHO_23930, partial [Vibrio parahaemolyticus]
KIFYCYIVCICSFFVLYGCENKKTDNNILTATGKDSVNVFLLKKETVNKNISFPGELLPLDRAEIFAKVSGY